MRERQEKVKNHYDSLSKRRKACLLQVNLSSCYVQKKPEKEEAVNIMNEIKGIYTAHPFKGYRRIGMDLQDLGYTINHKKVYRLMT
ncbi:MAG: IS3 family transposase [Alphaproteobacteria bacterium]|nr:IS3 family transposase [Alphaproteobacteria bacterium]